METARAQNDCHLVVRMASDLVEARIHGELGVEGGAKAAKICSQWATGESMPFFDYVPSWTAPRSEELTKSYET